MGTNDEGVVINDGDLNPDVQVELETLNSTSQQINELENKLQDLRNIYQISLTKWAGHLSDISAKIGSSIPKARPYFDLKRKILEVQRESQISAAKYDKANDILTEYKSILAKAESAPQLDDTAMEIINQSTYKINEAKKELERAHSEHRKCLEQYSQLNSTMVNLEKKYKNDIKKSKDYFHFSKTMEDQLKEEKMTIEVYEDKIRICKALYNKSLNNLEMISEKIHEERKFKSRLGPRGQGVGAENPPVEVVDEISINSTDKLNNAGSSNERSNSSSSKSSERNIQHSVMSNNKPFPHTIKYDKSTPIVNSLLEAMATSNAMNKPFKFMNKS